VFFFFSAGQGGRGVNLSEEVVLWFKGCVGLLCSAFSLLILI